MDWFNEHACKFLVLNWHFVLWLIQPIQIAKPWPVLKLGLGHRPSQNRLIFCIKISLRLDDRWQTVSLCPYRSIVAQRFQPLEIVSSKPFSTYCLFELIYRGLFFLLLENALSLNKLHSLKDLQLGSKWGDIAKLYVQVDWVIVDLWLLLFLGQNRIFQTWDWACNEISFLILFYLNNFSWKVITDLLVLLYNISNVSFLLYLFVLLTFL